MVDQVSSQVPECISTIGTERLVPSKHEFECVLVPIKLAGERREKQYTRVSRKSLSATLSWAEMFKDIEDSVAIRDM